MTQTKHLDHRKTYLECHCRDDHHSLQAVNTLSVTSGNCHIVEQTKTHRRIRKSMMPRRSHQHKRTREAAFQNSLNSFNSRTGSQFRRTVRFRTHPGISIKLQNSALLKRAFAFLFKLFDISLLMNTEQIFQRSCTWLNPRQIKQKFRAMQSFVDCSKTLRRLRMRLGRKVALKFLFVDES